MRSCVDLARNALSYILPSFALVCRLICYILRETFVEDVFLFFALCLEDFAAPREEMDNLLCVVDQ